MKRRRLKVSRTQPESRAARFPRSLPAPMPLLRLQGRWLDQAGFGIGAHVRVTVARGLLALEVIDEKSAD
jgi:Toxin SymE, type I toxin-antitoxin system